MLQKQTPFLTLNMRSLWLQLPFQTLLLPLPSKCSKAKPHWTIASKTCPASLPGCLLLVLHLCSQSLYPVPISPLILFNCALKCHTFLQPLLSCLLEPDIHSIFLLSHDIIHIYYVLYSFFCIQCCKNLESKLISFNVVNPRLILHF